jgi:hypothetical protein
MPKKKTSGGQSTGKPRGRPKAPVPKPPLSVVMTIRANQEWEDWIDRARDALVKRSGLAVRIERTVVVDSALVELAKVLELPPPPSRY